MFFRTQWNDGEPKEAVAGGEVAGVVLTKEQSRERSWYLTSWLFTGMKDHILCSFVSPIVPVSQEVPRYMLTN